MSLRRQFRCKLIGFRKGKDIDIMVRKGYYKRNSQSYSSNNQHRLSYLLGSLTPPPFLNHSGCGSSEKFGQDFVKQIYFAEVVSRLRADFNLSDRSLDLQP